MRDAWRSYDPIAETYARIAEGYYFAKPARALLSLLDPAPGSRVLDVGTGTGVVAALAVHLVGPGGLVVGLDPAVGMLRALRKRCSAEAVVGVLPLLPHPEASFDAIAAAFVLTHVSDYGGALDAMVKALRPGGRLAISAWGTSPSSTPPGEAWQVVVREFISHETLQAALGEALPWEERFSDPMFLEAALRVAGLTDTRVDQLKYPVAMATDAFVESRLISLPSRFMESVLPAREWRRFTEEASHRLAEAFGSQLCFEVRVNLGVGTKCAAEHSVVERTATGMRK